METSKTLEQIFKVLELLKESLYADALIEKEISPEEAENRISNIFKEAGQVFNVGTTTIMDKCTRKLKLKADEFYNLAVRYVTRQDEELEERIVDCRKDTIDSAEQTRVLLRNIRDK